MDARARTTAPRRCVDCHLPHDFVGKYLAKARQRLPPLEGVHAPGLPRADPDQAAERRDPPGQLPALPRRLRPRRRWCAARADREDAGTLRPLPSRRRARRARLTAPRRHRPNDADSTTNHPSRRTPPLIVAARRRHPSSSALSFGVRALLINIFQRKQEAKNPYLRLVEVSDETTDSGAVGHELAARSTTATGAPRDVSRTRYGGSEALPDEKIDRDPWLKRMFAGYAFSIDYRDRRGHAYMLADQEQTKRVTERPQPGTCLHCHASVIPTYRRLGERRRLEGVRRRWRSMPYAAAHAEVVKTGSSNPVAGGSRSEVRARRGRPPGRLRRLPRSEDDAAARDPPGLHAAASSALADSAAPTPHLPSIERWRKRDRAHALRSQRRRLAPGDAVVRLRPVPRRVLLRAQDDAVLPLEQGAEGRADRAAPTTTTSSPTATASTTGSTRRPAPRC